MITRAWATVGSRESNDVTPLFTIPERRVANRIAGDVGQVSPDSGAWRSQCYLAILNEEAQARFELKPRDGLFLDALTRFLTRVDIPQGYIHCNEGFLSDIRCGFFMTDHQPTAQFAEAMFRHRHRVVNISGFFLTLPGTGAEATLVPHLHVTCQRSDWGSLGSIVGGHLIEAATGQVTCQVVPLTGVPLTRETNPETGVMHIRSAHRDPDQPSAGDMVVFALAPGDEFPSRLVDALSSTNVEAGQLRFAVGTLWNATLQNDTGLHALHPRDGLEVTFAKGRLAVRGETDAPSVLVRLVDRYGRYTEGAIVRGRVKDLVEGAALIG